MKNKMFSGWKDVFLFTLKQGTSQRYKLFTIVLAAILLIGGLGINIYLATNQKNDDNVSPIEKVYVIDESEIAGIDWNGSVQLEQNQFPKVIFEQTTLSVKELGTELNDSQATSVILEIKKGTESFDITVFIPTGSEVTTADGENLANAIKNVVHEALLRTSEVEEDKIAYVVSYINTEFSIVGENAKSDNMLLLTTVFPLVFMFGLYFMVIIYGQSMGQIVSVEKSSKLMETLLVMTRPYGLIFGKIFATSLLAIIQIAVWVGATVIGFVFGESFAQDQIYTGYENTIISMFREIAADESAKAFSGTAIVLTVIAVCLAFLFYCMLAGAIASFASKADELGPVMSFFNMFIIIGFLGSYLIPAMVGAEWIKVLIRLVPMSSAFLLPGELLLGTVSSGAGVLYLIVLLAWIILTAVFAGKVYKDQVFYRGKSLKDRLPWMKRDKNEDSDEQWQLLHDEAGRPIDKSAKVGYFFLALVPLVIFFVIQIFTSYIMINIMTRTGLKGIDLSAWEVKEWVDFYYGIESKLNPMVLMANHICIITIFGLWMYFIRKGINRKNILHVKTLLKKRPVIILGICLISGLCLCALANGVVAMEGYLVPSIVENYLESAEAVGLGTSVFSIIAAVILAPIGEELLCRGICLHFGKKALGKFWYANVLQALLFGILHMNWVQGVYAFLIGLVLGILVERYESLLPAMIVHFIVNFSSTTWAPKVLAHMEDSFVTAILLVAVPSVIMIAVLYLTRKSNAEKNVQ